jgi:hypothetical protein
MATRIYINGSDLMAVAAYRTPRPVGTDRFFRLRTDAPDDFQAAYERAKAHYVEATHFSYLWECALEIGRRAGYAAVTAKGQTRERDLKFECEKETELKEGRSTNLQDGRKDGWQDEEVKRLKEEQDARFKLGHEAGLKVGKRVGFEAGSLFGERKARNHTGFPLDPAQKGRVMVDAAVETAVLIPPPTVKSWADESESLPIISLIPPPRNLAPLRSAVVGQRPFATLQRRLRRSYPLKRHQPTLPKLKQDTDCPMPTKTHSANLIITRKHPAGISPGKPVITVTSSPTSCLHKDEPQSMFSLDWDRDPRLFDLNRSLRALGWTRAVS